MQEALVSVLVSLASLLSVLAVWISQRTRKQVANGSAAAAAETRTGHCDAASPCAADSLRASMEELVLMERTTQERIAHSTEAITKTYTETSRAIAAALEKLTDQVMQDRLESAKREAFMEGRLSAIEKGA